MNEDFLDLATRRQFAMKVEQASLEVTEIAKQISNNIGDISVTEAKEAIIMEFRKRLYEKSYYGEFEGKK